MRRRMAQRKQRKRLGTKKSTLSKRKRVANNYTPIPCHVSIEKLVTLAELGLGVERQKKENGLQNWLEKAVTGLY